MERICLQCRKHSFDPWVRKILKRKKWQPTPVFLPGEIMDRGAWWATVQGFAKSWTGLKQLSTHYLLAHITEKGANK